MPRKTREPWIVVDKLNAGTLEVEGAITSVDLIHFNSDGTPPTSPELGDLWVDDDVLNFASAFEDVIAQLPFELWVDVRNESGVDIKNGEAVYVEGTSGNRRLIALAQANSSTTSCVLAIATHDIDDANNGIATTFGLVRDIDTTGTPVSEVWVEGERLFLSPTTPGELTNVPPTAPDELQPIGEVGRVHANQGNIMVRIRSGSTELNGRYVLNTGDTMTGDLIITADLAAESITASTALILTPSEGTDVTAVGGITPTNAIMYVQGDGGPITVTANPQIAAGTRDGELLFVVGMSDGNTITLNDGNGVHLHGQIVLHDHDAVLFWWDASDNEWEELARNNPTNTLTGFFSSRLGSFGTTYAEGYYQHETSPNDFSPAATLGTANISYAAHVYVVLGVLTVDEVTLTVTGTSITDAGVRTTSDTEDIVIPDATDPDAYYETAKKWIGQVSIVVASGTPKLCNFGFAKYYDNNNNSFTVVGIQVTGRGGANDSGANFGLRHHKATGWTYTGSGATPPPYIADMVTDHVTEVQIGNGLPIGWKRADLSTVIEGGDSEGILLEVVTGANNAIEQANFVVTYTPK